MCSHYAVYGDHPILQGGFGRMENCAGRNREMLSAPVSVRLTFQTRYKSPNKGQSHTKIMHQVLPGP